jgi:endonuclease-3 related protein
VEKIPVFYETLLRDYGPQGWWPLCDVCGSNPTSSGKSTGYHIGDYSYPVTAHQRFEIAAGAILTQNTSWPQAEKAVFALKNKGALSPEGVLSLPETELCQLIKPAGYFNQKSAYLRNISLYFQSLGAGTPDRESLLRVKGIGFETADSILLYAFGQPEFVVDAYTRRIFQHLGIVSSSDSYMDIKRLFENSLPCDVFLFQEYHALIVEHAKRFYSKKPYGQNCPLLELR